jgi:hydroxyethylthiazole kinase-like uncharacterized protein yjeF
MMHALYTIADLRKTESTAAARLSTGTLMQRAGQAAALAALSMLHAPFPDRKVLVLAGPGNNGGDALEVARHLDGSGCRVTVLLFAESAQQPLDARSAQERARRSRIRFATIDVEEEQVLAEPWDLVIDGLFGIGLRRSLPTNICHMIGAINALCCPVLALDIPSGLNADTGNLIGENAIAIRATATVTFIGDKPGLHTGDGRDYAGKVTVERLDIEPQLFPHVRMALNEPSLFAGRLQPRLHGTHKGTYGSVAIVGGSSGMIGAAILAARAALYAGAGRVIASFVDAPPPYDSAHPELMFREAASSDFQSTVVVAGPGLGQNRSAQETLARALAKSADTELPIVLDADALNLIAAHGRLQQQLARRRSGMIMTPHPLEAARLLGQTASEIQADRIAAARQLADRFNAVIILKGSGTIIAAPKAVTVVNPTGNPGLASGGTGDVLAGICGAMLAQGMPLLEAAFASVWLHGTAADKLVERGIGPAGLTASELMPEVRKAHNDLLTGHAFR